MVIKKFQYYNKKELKIGFVFIMTVSYPLQVIFLNKFYLYFGCQLTYLGFLFFHYKAMQNLEMISVI
jgi:hypothetical protein